MSRAEFNEITNRRSPRQLLLLRLLLLQLLQLLLLLLLLLWLRRIKPLRRRVDMSKFRSLRLLLEL